MSRSVAWSQGALLRPPRYRIREHLVFPFSRRSHSIVKRLDDLLEDSSRRSVELVVCQFVDAVLVVVLLIIPYENYSRAGSLIHLMAQTRLLY